MIFVVLTFMCIYTVPRKSDPLTDFATTCVQQIKHIFRYIQPHLFQTMF